MEGARRLPIVLRARELRASGQTWEQIQRATGIAIGTLIRWLNQVAGICAPSAKDCAPQNHKAGRPRKYNLTDAERSALAAATLRTNRTADDGSVQEAVRIARRRGDLSAELLDEVNRREAAGLPLLPESLHHQISQPASAYHQFRNPTDADLDYICAPGTMMWIDDELTGGERIPVRAGDILEADDATINFPICIPWPIGGCKVSDRWGVKVGRFQWLVAIDVASRYIPGFSYVSRPRGSYRAEDIVSLLLGLFRPHGVWRRCRFERGTFESNLVTSLLKSLGIIHHPVWSPHQKPFIEGLFSTMWTKLSLMPGQVGRFMGEMEDGNVLLTKCLSGSTDPKKHFPMIDQALAAMTAAIAEKNQTPIHSKNYGTWIPAERWQAHRAAHSRFMPFDPSSEFLFAPCVREWIVQGARVGGAVRMIEGAGPAGWSVQFDFGAEFLLPFDGCKVKAYFDPCAAVECAATIVLAENVRNHRVGEVLGVAPQINEVARYARRALGYFEDPDRGLEHRIKTAAALRREVRSILPNGKTQAASSEARDGLGNAIKVEVGTPRAPSETQSSSLSPQSSPEVFAARKSTQSRLAQIANQLREETAL